MGTDEVGDQSIEPWRKTFFVCNFWNVLCLYSFVCVSIWDRITIVQLLYESELKHVLYFYILFPFMFSFFCF